MLLANSKTKLVFSQSTSYREHENQIRQQHLSWSYLYHKGLLELDILPQLCYIQSVSFMRRNAGLTADRNQTRRS